MLLSAWRFESHQRTGHMRKKLPESQKTHKAHCLTWTHPPFLKKSDWLSPRNTCELEEIIMLWIQESLTCCDFKRTGYFCPMPEFWRKVSADGIQLPCGVKAHGLLSVLLAVRQATLLLYTMTDSLIKPHLKQLSLNHLPKEFQSNWPELSHELDKAIKEKAKV